MATYGKNKIKLHMIKKYFIPALVFALSTIVTHAQEIRKILFLGNSYTYVNDLPKTIHDVAKAMGDSVFYDSNTPGSCTLNIHSTNATSIAKINSQQWDYVILQEQSQMPSFPPSQVATDVFPYAHKLDSIITANDSCTETVFYMTWGRKNGDQTNCASYPPVCTYEGMQERLRQSYLQMGMDNSATVAPVGMAWYKTRMLNPVFDLYQADESHPSIYGTYLTACVFYATLFHKSPEGCSFISTLSASDAATLQQVAAITVFDSLDQWAGSGDNAFARFTYSVNGTNVQFNDTSLNANNWFWNFGDGQTSASNNPLHSYASTGNYTVMLVVSNTCFSDTLIQNVNVTPLGIDRVQKESQIIVYPNPSEGVFNLTIQDEFSAIKIFNYTGQLVKGIPCFNTIQKTIDLTGLPDGLYVAVINFGKTTARLCLVKR
jgi:hypothetical protein